MVDKHQQSPHFQKQILNETLAKQLRYGKYKCSVCLSFIQRLDSLWSCKFCYCIIHLKCLKEWVFKVSSQSLQVPSSFSSTPALNDITTTSTEMSSKSKQSSPARFRWNCPSCRGFYESHILPKDLCWCGRIQNPEPPPIGSVTHCCNFQCPRKKGSSELYICPHPCPLLCHPGPCPPCNVVLKLSCYCGKIKERAIQCSEIRDIEGGISCGKICEKLLSCKKHKCNQVCHPGPCKPCGITEDVPCRCGKEIKSQICGSYIIPQCTNPCKRLSKCGYHICDRICHSIREKRYINDINTTSDETTHHRCPLPCLKDPSRITRCPCGKESIDFSLRKHCTDPIPTCNNICNKPFPCGHNCQRLCHEDSCGSCNEKIVQLCRCGRLQQEVICGSLSLPLSQQTPIQCTRVCNRFKSCKKHKCKVLCCPDFYNGINAEAHLCLEACGKFLDCEKHTCDNFCHLGACPPCLVINTTPGICACGETSLPLTYLCQERLPQCPNKCKKILPCGHHCEARCHYDECPKCEILVTKRCIGDHEDRVNVPCWVNLENIVCRNRCNKVKEPCHIHRCSQTCHAGTCGECHEECGKLRQYCVHRCTAPCHFEESQCPDIPCTIMHEITCPCGRRKQHIQCKRWSGNSKDPITELKCDKKCFDEQRQRQLAEAFEPEKFSPLISKNATYSDVLVSWASINLQLVREFEMFAENAVTKRGTCCCFRPLKTIDALWLDSYSQQYYGLNTEKQMELANGSWYLAISYDSKDTSRLPMPLLSDIATTLNTVVSNNSSGSSNYRNTNDNNTIECLKYSTGASSSGIIDFGTHPYRLMCEDRTPEITSREIHKRLTALQGRYRLFWISIKTLKSRNFSTSLKLLPSNLGQGICHLIIDVLTQTDADYVLKVADSFPFVFGPCRLLRQSTKLKKTTDIAAIDKNEGDDDTEEGWSVVVKRK